MAAVALLVSPACGREDAGRPVRRALDVAPPSDPSAGCRPGRAGALNGAQWTVAVAGETRRALVDAPADAGDRPLPLVLVFHGFRSDPENLRAGAGWPVLAAREPMTVVHPEGHDGVRLLDTTGRGWDLRPGETRDADFVRALLDKLEAERCVDRRRVFATGFSNGGFFSNLLGCVLADRLAAVAPVAGALPLGDCRPAGAVPILFFYGRSDQVIDAALVHGARDWWVGADRCGVPADADGCAAYAGCAADVVYCEGSQGHVWPPDATPRIWQFFRAHPRAAGW